MSHHKNKFLNLIQSSVKPLNSNFGGAYLTWQVLGASVLIVGAFMGLTKQFVQFSKTSNDQTQNTQGLEYKQDLLSKAQLLLTKTYNSEDDSLRTEGICSLVSLSEQTQISAKVELDFSKKLMTASRLSNAFENDLKWVILSNNSKCDIFDTKPTICLQGRIDSKGMITTDVNQDLIASVSIEPKVIDVDPLDGGSSQLISTGVQKHDISKVMYQIEIFVSSIKPNAGTSIPAKQSSLKKLLWAGSVDYCDVRSGSDYVRVSASATGKLDDNILYNFSKKPTSATPTTPPISLEAMDRYTTDVIMSNDSDGAPNGDRFARFMKPDPSKRRALSCMEKRFTCEPGRDSSSYNGSYTKQSPVRQRQFIDPEIDLNVSFNLKLDGENSYEFSPNLRVAHQNDFIVSAGKYVPKSDHNGISILKSNHYKVRNETSVYKKTGNHFQTTQASTPSDQKKMKLSRNTSSLSYQIDDSSSQMCNKICETKRTSGASYYYFTDYLLKNFFQSDKISKSDYIENPLVSKPGNNYEGIDLHYNRTDSANYDAVGCNLCNRKNCREPNINTWIPLEDKRQEPLDSLIPECAVQTENLALARTHVLGNPITSQRERYTNQLNNGSYNDAQCPVLEVHKTTFVDRPVHTRDDADAAYYIKKNVNCGKSLPIICYGVGKHTFAKFTNRNVRRGTFEQARQWCYELGLEELVVKDKKRGLINAFFPQGKESFKDVLTTPSYSGDSNNIPNGTFAFSWASGNVIRFPNLSRIGLFMGPDTPEQMVISKEIMNHHIFRDDPGLIKINGNQFQIWIGYDIEKIDDMFLISSQIPFIPEIFLYYNQANNLYYAPDGKMKLDTFRGNIKNFFPSAVTQEPTPTGGAWHGILIHDVRYRGVIKSRQTTSGNALPFICRNKSNPGIYFKTSRTSRNWANGHNYCRLQNGLFVAPSTGLHWSQAMLELTKDGSTHLNGLPEYYPFPDPKIHKNKAAWVGLYGSNAADLVQNIKYQNFNSTSGIPSLDNPDLPRLFEPNGLVDDPLTPEDEVFDSYSDYNNYCVIGSNWTADEIDTPNREICLSKMGDKIIKTSGTCTGLGLKRLKKSQLTTNHTIQRLFLTYFNTSSSSRIGGGELVNLCN